MFKAPPSKAEFHKKFGDKVLGDFDSDEDKKRNDEEAPIRKRYIKNYYLVVIRLLKMF